MLASEEEVAVAVVAKVIRMQIEERQEVAVVEELDSLLEKVLPTLVDVVAVADLVDQMLVLQVLDLVEMDILMQEKLLVVVEETVDHLEILQMLVIHLKQVVVQQVEMVLR